MRNDLTDITLVMDRSGSMATVRKEAESGINHFILDQKNKPGQALFTMVQFDNEYEVVHAGVPIAEVEEIHLHPRGMTALLDAVGKAINVTGERLSKIPEADRPGLVVFVIVTDGEENASHEFNLDQIRKMIEHQRSAYQWEFTFLGANQDAFAGAASMGIPVMAAANFAGQNVHVAYASTSENLGRMRKSRLVGDTVVNSYTDAERSAMTGGSSE